MNKYIVIIITEFLTHYEKDEFIYDDVELALNNWEYAQQCSCPEHCGANIKIITPFCYE